MIWRMIFRWSLFPILPDHLLLVLLLHALLLLEGHRCQGQDKEVEMFEDAF